MSVMVIMRGLPGSGKSTVTETFRCQGFAVCSADDFFMVGGEYRFDRARLKDAHDACFEKARRAVATGRPVVIDNTNIRRRDFARYIALAEEYGYRVTELTVGRPTDPAFAELCAKRNVHRVPRNTILRMSREFEP